jgi:phosphatidylglycerophosphate synthase
MSIYRSVVGRKGVSIPARNTAKLKTLLQSVAVALCLVPPLTRHHTVLVVAIWAATILTVFTGGQYYLDGRKPVPPAHTHPMDPRDGD